MVHVCASVKSRAQLLADFLFLSISVCPSALKCNINKSPGRQIEMNTESDRNQNMDKSMARVLPC